MITRIAGGLAILLLGAAVLAQPPMPPRPASVSNQLQYLVNQYASGKMSLQTLSSSVAGIAAANPAPTNAPPPTNMVVTIDAKAGETYFFYYTTNLQRSTGSNGTVSLNFPHWFYLWTYVSPSNGPVTFNWPIPTNQPRAWVKCL
jgi:hypothetical protein